MRVKACVYSGSWLANYSIHLGHDTLLEDLIELLGVTNLGFLLLIWAAE